MNKTDAIKIAEFQLKKQKLVVPFSQFNEAVEKALGRRIYIEEYIYPERLLEELRIKNYD